MGRDLPGGANPPGEPRLDGDVSPHLQPARRRATFAHAKSAKWRGQKRKPPSDEDGFFAL